MANELELIHYGTKGMKWGVRKSELSSASRSERKTLKKQHKSNVKEQRSDPHYKKNAKGFRGQSASHKAVKTSAVVAGYAAGIRIVKTPVAIMSLRGGDKAAALGTGIRISAGILGGSVGAMAANKLEASRRASEDINKKRSK